MEIIKVFEQHAPEQGKNMKYAYQVIRSGRKTAALEIDENCRLILRVPFRYSDKDAEKLAEDHMQWIEKHMKIQKDRKQKRKTLTEEDIAALKEKAKREIPLKVARYSKQMGLYPTSVKITSARKRFGSCSGKNGLCFSYLLMQYPEAAVDYVVVHELAHIRHKNHGEAFYALIAAYLPDYKERIRLLKGR